VPFFFKKKKQYYQRYFEPNPFSGSNGDPVPNFSRFGQLVFYKEELYS